MRASIADLVLELTMTWASLLVLGGIVWVSLTVNRWIFLMLPLGVGVVIIWGSTLLNR